MALYGLFAPQQKEAHSGEYHKTFNGDNFIHFWKNQLLCSHSHQSPIIMENAKCHKKKPQDTFNPSKINNSAILAKFFGVGFDTEAGMSAVELE